MPRLPDAFELCRPPRVARLRAAFWAVEDALRARAVGRSRTIVEPPPAPPPVEPRAMTSERVRVLRWLFTRGDERLQCELALSTDTAWYELRTTPSTVPASQTLERFTDVTAAFERQSAIEGALVSDGWSLEAYESVVIERPAEPGAAV